jgi:hypothetical protein
MEISPDYILSFKNHPDVAKLDNSTLEYINKLGCFNDYKNKFVKKTHNHILKNPKMQNIKDSLDNKVNLIMNKLSETNINNLLLEFINNIGQITIAEYNIIQKTVYIKMMNEINFIKIYIDFFIKLNHLYSSVVNYDITTFIHIIQAKFENDYCNKDIGEEYSFLSTFDGEQKRINNLVIIRNCIESQVLSFDLFNLCTDLLFNQTKYLADIYFWFLFDKNISSENIKKIHKVLLTPNIDTRDRILLESLTTNTQVSINKKESHTTIPISKNIIKDTLSMEINNILEEYILIESLDDVYYFIDKKCPDALSKNKFCLCAITMYLETNDNKLIQLITTLYNSQVINSSQIKNGGELYKKKNNMDVTKYNTFMNIINARNTNS